MEGEMCELKRVGQGKTICIPLRGYQRFSFVESSSGTTRARSSYRSSCLAYCETLVYKLENLVAGMKHVVTNSDVLLLIGGKGYLENSSSAGA